MTATISSSPKLEAADRLSPSPSGSPLRLALAPSGSTPPLLDGAWWPRSRDLAAELPLLAAVLDPLWGRITRITVNPTHWPTVPRKVSVAGHVVKVGWFRLEQDEHELLLLSYHVGRWNLLVIPPSTPPGTAAWLMTAATDPLGTSSGSRLMEEAARLGTTSEAEGNEKDGDADGSGDGAAVWDSEGGHEAREVEGRHEAGDRSPAARTRIPAQPRT